MGWWVLSFDWAEASLGVAVARLKQHHLHACVIGAAENGVVRLRAYVADSVGRRVVLGLAQHLAMEADQRGLTPPCVRLRKTDVCASEADWPPTPIGERLLIQPDSHPLPESTERAVVRLLPRVAFGATHATTLLCLEALERRELEGVAVADIGCGSGILALAAAALGARCVSAVDVDPLSVGATRDNRDLNGMRPKVVRVAEGSVAALVGESFDVIVCNTFTTVLGQIVPRLCEVAAPACWAALSGIRAGEEPTVEALCQASGWRVVEWMNKGDWVMAEARRVMEGD